MQYPSSNRFEDVATFSSSPMRSLSADSLPLEASSTVRRNLLSPSLTHLSAKLAHTALDSPLSTPQAVHPKALSFANGSPSPLRKSFSLADADEPQHMVDFDASQNTTSSSMSDDSITTEQSSLLYNASRGHRLSRRSRSAMQLSLSTIAEPDDVGGNASGSDAASPSSKHNSPLKSSGGAPPPLQMTSSPTTPAPLTAPVALSRHFDFAAVDPDQPLSARSASSPSHRLPSVSSSCDAGWLATRHGYGRTIGKYTCHSIEESPLRLNGSKRRAHGSPRQLHEQLDDESDSSRRSPSLGSDITLCILTMATTFHVKSDDIALLAGYPAPSPIFSGKKIGAKKVKVGQRQRSMSISVSSSSSTSSSSSSPAVLAAIAQQATSNSTIIREHAISSNVAMASEPTWEEYSCTLPTVQGTSGPIKRISTETMIGLLQGKFHGQLDHFVVVDARYVYEYEGGHIPGSFNYNTRQKVEDFFHANRQVDRKVAIIFHCEYSKNRGPRCCEHFRQLDRQHNEYPKLTFPELYVLDGGYRKFHKDFPKKCSPEDAYVSMWDDKYKLENKACTMRWRRGWTATSRKRTRGQRHRPRSRSLASSALALRRSNSSPPEHLSDCSKDLFSPRSLNSAHRCQSDTSGYVRAMAQAPEPSSSSSGSSSASLDSPLSASSAVENVPMDVNRGRAMPRLALDRLQKPTALPHSAGAERGKLGHAGGGRRQVLSARLHKPSNSRRKNGGRRRRGLHARPLKR